MAAKPLYACGTCGLHFSRRYNAQRHNKNLHDNRADIVTFSEYMVGRKSGKYPPGNPSFYRIKNSNAGKPNIVHQYDNNTYYNQQKHVLDSAKTNPMCNSRDNMPSARNQFDIERYIIFDNLLQSFDRARESRKKQEIEELIYEIGKRLSDFLTPEQMQAIVTGFKCKLDATTDYTALYTELYNYRTRLVNRALGRPTGSDTYTNNPN